MRRRLSQCRWFVPLLPVLLLFARPAQAQSMLADPAPRALPAANSFYPPHEPSELFYDGQLPPRTGPFTPAWKPTWLQEARFDWNTVYGGQGATMGETELATDSTWAVPWMVMGSPWLITPHFGGHFLNGPTVTDMPGHLYDVSLEFGRLLQIAPGWQLETAYAPVFYSDFDQGNSQALRLTGRLVGYREWSTTTQLVLGATYLARFDYPVLPVAGFIWAPDDLTRVDLVFPRPKFQRRLCLPQQLKQLSSSSLANLLGYFPEDEYWWFVRWDLGGNTYAIRRASGASDMVTFREFRLSLGYERRGANGIINRADIGWSFGRDLKYSSGPTHYPLTDALTLRSEYAF